MIPDIPRDMAEVVQIDSLGSQGDGVTAEGLFVPRCLPGERVEVRSSGHRAELISVLTRAEERKSPVCPHFGQCGGCSLQHASDALVRDWKRDQIRQALAARGIDQVEIRETITCPPNSRRRAVFSGRRTKKERLIGFHAAGTHDLVPISACPVVTPRLIGCLPALQELVGAGGSRKKELRFTVLDTETGCDVSVMDGKPLEGALYGNLVAIAATADLARLSWDGEPVVTRRVPTLSMGRAQVAAPPGAFVQATAAGEHALVSHVVKTLEAAKSVADLFGGIGTFTFPLAESTKVRAVESSREAVAALDQAWRNTEGLKEVVTETRDLFRRPLLARELSAFDGVVFDPPRQGARAQCEELAQSGVARISAVSCNPATFARDARILLDGGYTLDWLQPVDQFRWTAHVELVAQFSRS